MNKKKLLALLMALVMTLTLVPVTALADGPEQSNTVTFLLRDSVGDMTISVQTDTYTFQTQEGVQRNGAAVYNSMTQTVAHNGTATEPSGKPSYWYHSDKTFPAGNNDGVTFTVDDSKGYVFDGWRLQGTDVRYDFSTPVTGNITLVPHFSVTGAIFEINNEAELLAFAREVNLGRGYISENWSGSVRQTVKLTTDITLTAAWTPIAGNFHGIFDGNGHTISGLVINDTTAGSDGTGFFTNSGKGGNSVVVQNLTFKNPSVTSTGSHVGVLFGKADSVTITNVVVNNPYVLCTGNDGGNVGGLIGSVNNNVDKNESSVSTISGCSVNGGSISCTGSDGRMVGGLIGQALRYLTITDCSVSGTTIGGYRKIGGVIGQANDMYMHCTGISVSGVTLVSSATTSYAKDLTMGGLVGQFAGVNTSTVNISGTVNNITMTGPVSIASGNYIMGLVSGGTGDTVADAEAAMKDRMTFSVTVSGTNTCTINNETTYQGIMGTQAEPSVAYVAQIDSTGYATLAEAVNAAKSQSNATVKLLTDVTLDSRVDVSGSMTIDLNGKTIYPTASCANGSAFNVTAGSYDVTITNGTIDGKAITDIECDPITVRSGAKLTLNNLNVYIKTQNGACVYPFDGATVLIESGNYANYTAETYQYLSSYQGMAVNQANVTTQLISIKGGSFYQVDPALGDDSGKVASFIADGYESVAKTNDDNQTWYVVGKIQTTDIAKQSSSSDTTAVYTANKTVVDTTNNEVLSTDKTITVNVTANQTDSVQTTAAAKAPAALSNIKDMNDFVETVTSKTGNASNIDVVIQVAKGEADTSTSGKVTYEVHPEAIITVSGSQESTTVKLTNDQIQGTFSFKLYVPDTVAAANGKVTVIHKHADGTEENLGTFTVSSDHTITLTGISSFSEFALQGTDENAVTVTTLGASLRRRVKVSSPTEVVNTSTDFRMTFQWTLPEGVNLDAAEGACYFLWSKDNGVTWNKVNITDFSENTASIVITGVPKVAFDTTIKSKIHLKYTGGASGEIEVSGYDRSVNYVAIELAKRGNSDLWGAYGTHLLSTNSIYTITGNGFSFSE